MSKLKPLGADWLVAAYRYLQNNVSLAKMGFALQELPVPWSCKINQVLLNLIKSLIVDLCFKLHNHVYTGTLIIVQHFNLNYNHYTVLLQFTSQSDTCGKGKQTPFSKH